MKKILAFLLLCLGLLHLGAAAEEAPAPVQVKTGLFITQLGEFEMAKRGFSAVFWSWFLHSDREYNPHQSVEVVNAKSDSVKFSSIDKVQDLRWYQQKHSIVASQDWDITRFPFDRQELKIVLEDGIKDLQSVEFVADTKESGIDPTVKIPGWTIEKFNIGVQSHAYPTTYGDPHLEGGSEYSQVVATITVKRDGGRLMLSMFIGFWVALLLAFLSYFLDFDMAPTRVTLCTAAVFGTVGNKYSIDNALPPSPYFTLADTVVTATFSAIVMAVLSVVLVQAWRKQRPAWAKAANRILGLLTGLSAVAMWVMVAQAAAA